MLQAALCHRQAAASPAESGLMPWILQDHDVLVEKHVALARKLREHMEAQAEPAEDSARAQMQQALATAVTDAITLAGKLAAAEEKLRWGGTLMRGSSAPACSVDPKLLGPAFGSSMDNSEAWCCLPCRQQEILAAAQAEGSVQGANSSLAADLVQATVQQAQTMRQVSLYSTLSKGYGQIPRGTAFTPYRCADGCHAKHMAWRRP